MTKPFTEIQRFDQPWLWCLLGAIAVLPVSATGFQPAALVPSAIVAAMMILLATSRLCVHVAPGGVHVHFYPFLRDTIAWENIRSARACQYRPIRDWGGWGIRMWRKGIAYTTNGNQGVMLELANGSHVLLGSRQADRLARAINGRLGLKATKLRDGTGQ